MSRSGVEFDRPPIVEMVLGVQFSPLGGLTAAHLGWFWKQYLGPEWDSATNATPIPDQFELFVEQQWQLLQPLRILLGDGTDTGRIQLSSDQGERMIQLQPTRFHYNWQKRQGIYPRYENVRKTFDEHFRAFGEFADQAGIGPLEPNQWEVIYVDHISRGEMWQKPDDWHRIVPGLFPPPTRLSLSAFESIGGEWHFEIEPQRGRLHIAASLGHIGDTEETALQLNFTARGLVSKQMSLTDGMDLGHDAIIDAFLKLTSPEAQQTWGIRR